MQLTRAITYTIANTPYSTINDKLYYSLFTILQFSLWWTRELRIKLIKCMDWIILCRLRAECAQNISHYSRIEFFVSEGGEKDEMTVKRLVFTWMGFESNNITINLLIFKTLFPHRMVSVLTNTNFGIWSHFIIFRLWSIAPVRNLKCGTIFIGKMLKCCWEMKPKLSV